MQGTDELICSLDEAKLAVSKLTAVLGTAVEKLQGQEQGTKPLPEVPRKPATVSQFLSQLGVSPHFKGYQYTAKAIELVLEKPEIFHGGVTKMLYPAIASKFPEATPSRVERNIRHAAEVLFLEGNKTEDLKKLFPRYAEKGKPANAEFIATLAEFLRNAS